MNPATGPLNFLTAILGTGAGMDLMRRAYAAGPLDVPMMRYKAAHRGVRALDLEEMAFMSRWGEAVRATSRWFL